MTVVFAGGGTAGHLYPAIAIADALRKRSATILFVGTADRLEARIVPQAGYPLYTIAGHAFPRRPSLEFVAAIAANVKGTFQSLRFLGAQRPDLVVATGGYVCFPLALAARLRRMLRLTRAPLVLLEPNVKPGLANRLLTPIVDEVWRDVPVRPSLQRLPMRDEALAALSLDPARCTLVAIGGSQGSRAINDALLAVMESGTLPSGWQLLHLTGAGDYDRVAARRQASVPFDAPYVIRGYLDEMAHVYAAADLLITRAGASTLAELATLGKPAILVPYPFAAQGHQAENALPFERAGAAVIITDEELQRGGLPGLLAATADDRRLSELAQNAERLKGSDAIESILARIDSLVPRKNER